MKQFLESLSRNAPALQAIGEREICQAKATGRFFVFFVDAFPPEA
jgi:hypothetical protein